MAESPSGSMVASQQQANKVFSVQKIPQGPVLVNLLISPTSIEQSLLTEKASVFETAHTPNSSGGDSHTLGLM